MLTLKNLMQRFTNHDQNIAESYLTRQPGFKPHHLKACMCQSAMEDVSTTQSLSPFIDMYA